MKNNKSGFFLVILISFFAIQFIGCNEKATDPATTETDSISDIDGNIYKTVKIGTKWWMAENLKAKRYNNGDSIYYVPQSKPESEWSNLDKGAYCKLDEKFGLLYNFYASSDARKLAPVGWHIPTDDEWKELEINLGMNTEDLDKLNWRGSDQGNKLKIMGGNTSYWATSTDIYTTFGNNNSGFTALGGACRIFNGLWGDLTHTAFWWSSSMHENEAWYRGLEYNKSNVFRDFGPLTYGFSIRCVKD